MDASALSAWVRESESLFAFPGILILHTLGMAMSAGAAFAMSLRALQPSLSGKLKGVWNLFGMRTIDTVMKKTAPKWWYENKKKKIFANAERELSAV